MATAASNRVSRASRARTRGGSGGPSQCDGAGIVGIRLARPRVAMRRAGESGCRCVQRGGGGRAEGGTVWAALPATAGGRFFFSVARARRVFQFSPPPPPPFLSRRARPCVNQRGRRSPPSLSPAAPPRRKEGRPQAVRGTSVRHRASPAPPPMLGRLLGSKVGAVRGVLAVLNGGLCDGGHPRGRGGGGEGRDHIERVARIVLASVAVPPSRPRPFGLGVRMDRDARRTRRARPLMHSLPLFSHSARRRRGQAQEADQGQAGREERVLLR